MRPAVLRFIVAAIVLVVVVRARAQGTAGMAPMEGMEAVPAPEQLPVPVRMTGIGNSHIAINASAETQAWFDQGLSLLHDFWDNESAKAFEQAIRTDPNCAMCYWGLVQAEEFRGEDQKSYADKALEQAVRLERKASKTNRLYIEAAVAESREKGDDHSASIAIYRRLVKKEPKDIEARIYLAEAVGDGFDDKGDPKPGQKEKMAILESVLKEAPNDSAANHYWIHAVEPSNHPERAIVSAALLASLAPTSGHMVHMPGHIYYRVGDYASAGHWFAASTEADERYMREQNVSADQDWNYVHNFMYAIADQMEQGHLEEANQLSDRLAGARGHLSASLYIWSARDQMARISRRLPVALRVGAWNDVLAMIENAKLADTDKTTNLRFMKDELGRFAAGMQALDQGNLAAARTASAEMDAGLWRRSEALKAEAADKAKADADKAKSESSHTKSNTAAPPATTAVNPDALADPLMNSLTVTSLELRAGVELLEGNLESAKKMYAQAIAAEKKLGYHEPPLYIRPVAETEGEAMLRANDYTDAKVAFQAALIERPQSGFELYGIARADELAGKLSDAESEYRAFLKVWSSADSSLPQLHHAREVLGVSGTAATK